MRVYLTFHVEWAPDFVVAQVLELVGNTPAAFLVTHPSPIVDEVRSARQDLGWHPNFLPGSTQGHSPAAVLDYLAAIVPAPVAVRSHKYACDTTILNMYVERGVKLDLTSLDYLNPFIEPRTYWNGLQRCATFWEDTVHIVRADPYQRSLYLPDGPGALVYNFHPIHIVLNSNSMEPYRAMLRALRGPSHLASWADLRPYVNPGYGVRNVLAEILEAVRLRQVGAGRLDELLSSRWALLSDN